MQCAQPLPAMWGPQLDLHIAGTGEVETERGEVKHRHRAGRGSGILGCEQRGLQRATRDGKIPVGVWSRKRVQSPTKLSCKQGAVGRGHSCELPSVAKLWAQ